MENHPTIAKTIRFAALTISTAAIIIGFSFWGLVLEYYLTTSQICNIPINSIIYLLVYTTAEAWLTCKLYNLYTTTPVYRLLITLPYAAVLTFCAVKSLSLFNLLFSDLLVNLRYEL